MRNDKVCKQSSIWVHANEAYVQCPYNGQFMSFIWIKFQWGVRCLDQNHVPKKTKTKMEIIKRKKQNKICEIRTKFYLVY